jgi:hypothetical protein
MERAPEVGKRGGDRSWAGRSRGVRAEGGSDSSRLHGPAPEGAGAGRNPRSRSCLRRRGSSVEQAGGLAGRNLRSRGCLRRRGSPVARPGGLTGRNLRSRPGVSAEPAPVSTRRGASARGDWAAAAPMGSRKGRARDRTSGSRRSHVHQASRPLADAGPRRSTRNAGHDRRCTAPRPQGDAIAPAASRSEPFGRTRVHEARPQAVLPPGGAVSGRGLRLGGASL